MHTAGRSSPLPSFLAINWHRVGIRRRSLVVGGDVVHAGLAGESQPAQSPAAWRAAGALTGDGEGVSDTVGVVGVGVVFVFFSMPPTPTSAFILFSSRCRQHPTPAYYRPTPQPLPAKRNSVSQRRQRCPRARRDNTCLCGLCVCLVPHERSSAQVIFWLEYLLCSYYIVVDDDNY